jgi:hypothetical protein
MKSDVALVASRDWETSRIAAIFHPTVAGIDPRLFDCVLNWIFASIAQIGLIFLLFLIGLEFDFSHLRWHGKAAPAISAAGGIRVSTANRGPGAASMTARITGWMRRIGIGTAIDRRRRRARRRRWAEAFAMGLMGCRQKHEC